MNTSMNDDRQSSSGESSKYDPGNWFFSHVLLTFGTIGYYLLWLVQTWLLGKKDPELTPVHQCIFCNCQTREYQEKVLGGKNKILYRDEICYVIKDYKPKGPVHYLVIPLKHITNVKQVLREGGAQHLATLEHMKKVALEFAREHEGMEPQEVTLTFHVPPFYSINHLHMHITSDRYDSFWKRFVFYYDTSWNINVETVLQRLRQVDSLCAASHTGSISPLKKIL